MFSWFRVSIVGMLWLVSAAHVYAQDVSLCGPPPALSPILENDESLKGQLKGQADFLTKFVGRAELGGEVEAARKQLYQSSDGFLAAQKDAYLAYVFCVILLQDKNLDTLKKLEALQAFKAAAPKPSPSPKASNEPVTMALAENEVHPLDGYQFVHPPTLPAGIAPGIVLPVGGRARVIFQATDVDTIAEIERVSLVSERHELPPLENLKYSIDPSRLSGFGAAKPHSFNVRLLKGKTEISYLTDKNSSVQARPNDLLASTPAPLLRLDRTAGLQETLDFVVLAADAGLYEIQLVAYVVSSGKSYELKTKSLYVVRQ